MNILNFLELQNKFNFVIDIDYLDFRSGIAFQYSKYVLILRDKTKLFVTEFVSFDERSYSYHLQDAKDGLIQRWDNSRHHHEIATFPHHTHLDDEILPSQEITLEDVLSLLSKRFN